MIQVFHYYQEYFRSLKTRMESKIMYWYIVVPVYCGDHCTLRHVSVKVLSIFVPPCSNTKLEITAFGSFACVMFLKHVFLNSMIYENIRITLFEEALKYWTKKKRRISNKMQDIDR